jgi:hypothetical protein
VVLATVAHVAEAALTRCTEKAVMTCVWALDLARRQALGETREEEAAAVEDAATAAITAAADAADLVAYQAAAAAGAAAFDATAATAYAVNAVTDATDEAGLDAAHTSSRRRLVDSLGAPGKWGPIRRLVRDGVEVVVAGDYAWVCDDGALGYRRVIGLSEGPIGVLFDELRVAE